MSSNWKCDGYNNEENTWEFTMMIICVLYDGFDKLEVNVGLLGTRFITW
jgi:hypothetical protein